MHPICHLHFTLIFPSIRFQAFVHRHCVRISSKSGRFRLDFCYVFDYHAESHQKDGASMGESTRAEISALAENLQSAERWHEVDTLLRAHQD